MRVNNEHVARLLEARLQRVHRASPPTGGSARQSAPASAGSDHATFSALASDLRVALAASTASEAPDPRLDALRAQVQAGRYRAPAQAVAEAMLRDLRG